MTYIRKNSLIIL